MSNQNYKFDSAPLIAGAIAGTATTGALLAFKNRGFLASKGLIAFKRPKFPSMEETDNNLKKVSDYIASQFPRGLSKPGMVTGSPGSGKSFSTEKIAINLSENASIPGSFKNIGLDFTKKRIDNTDPHSLYEWSQGSSYFRPENFDVLVTIDPPSPKEQVRRIASREHSESTSKLIKGNVLKQSELQQKVAKDRIKTPFKQIGPYKVYIKPKVKNEYENYSDQEWYNSIVTKVRGEKYAPEGRQHFKFENDPKAGQLDAGDVIKGVGAGALVAGGTGLVRHLSNNEINKVASYAHVPLYSSINDIKTKIKGLGLKINDY